jgi:hypothetical protein
LIIRVSPGGRKAPSAKRVGGVVSSRAVAQDRGKQRGRSPAAALL